MAKNLAQRYIDGLEDHYGQFGLADDWQAFMNTVHGATPEDLAAIKEKFLEVPQTLLDLLSIVDGTYWREYEGEQIAVLLLGGAEDIAYYLLSSEQIVNDTDASILIENMLEFEEDLRAQDLIDGRVELNKNANWLHFADCFNNGGTSQLFIDFTPSPKGKPGQVIMFVHDPDEFIVIADSFDEYLQNLMESEYDFLEEEDCYFE